MNKFLYDAHICKSFWIIISMVILIQISIPSLLLLYVIDELDDFNLTIKAIGHQWYWKYEYRDFWSIENFQGKFNLSTTINSQLEIDIFRLLDINNTDQLQLVPVPSKNSFLNRWTPICMIDNSKRPGSTSTSTATSNPYPEYLPIERGPIFGFSTWEAYEANIKSSHLIYQSIIEGIYPTVGEQIEMKNNLINHAFMWIIVIFSVIIFL